MSSINKKFDVTVFGATGLTGKHIVRHIFQLATDNPNLLPSNFNWAIAGRNEENLEAIVQEMLQAYAQASINPPSVLVASVTQRENLDNITGQTKVLINAVGPFRFMGEYVVRSCVEQGCHYVDVTGEPEFVERMQRTYHEKAVSNRVTIVHSCGFDSVPTDMGVLYTKKLYTEKGWVPSQIEMFFKMHTGEAGMRGGYATYESAVHGFGSAELLREIRKASMLKKLGAPVGSRLKFHKGVTKDKEYGYHVPFVFADPSIVRLSQQIFLTGYANTSDNNESIPPTVQFTAYLLLPSLWAVVLYMFYGFIFSFLAGSHWGRQLLLKHPKFFSAGLFGREHPSQTQLDQTSFEVILRSKGYEQVPIDDKMQPTKSLKVVVRGPEPGYVATPRLVLQSALVLLQHERVPCGVFTPSTAFWQTDLIQRLGQVGIHFDISD
ncbi:hypothetical protein G6F46_002048 [Rhizopus delemar]|uniref:Saccharopine dehydrogenase NADP binding domain-containing protein n=2 Tax=Rhizopus TaxID=4842 RepID=A0A9P6Z3Y8_9FUNG|nr:hypothetical protein G6F55_005190 [Rhizopus delemar]KAG1550980.1 hypothetical protein G6F51_002117 [Rhizopus arrhizus]KAG1497230.1 hypothetical protein G6F54_005906 [Rhizopus delemar]KAG1511484.1 hypothetical protein G6F53_005906 [Rhizopus delemar]KAG1522089.1 hypothetical protein G6F52_006164 [Rhizopus delemar]